jgi:hypothetical protein
MGATAPLRLCQPLLHQLKQLHHPSYRIDKGSQKDVRAEKNKVRRREMKTPHIFEAAIVDPKENIALQHHRSHQDGHACIIEELVERIVDRAFQHVHT